MDYDITPEKPTDNKQIETSSEVFLSEPKKTYTTLYMVIGIFMCAAIFVSCVFFMFLPPKSFTPGDILIPDGSSIKQTSKILKEKNIIKNKSLFNFCTRIVAKKKSIRAGEYSFDTPEHVCRVAYRLSRGIYGNAQIKITVPEGSTNTEIAQIIKTKEPNFDTESFLKLAKPLQGELFPETYFFFKNFTPQEVVKEMHDTYTEKTADIFSTVTDEKKQLDIITMASILEREANNAEEAKVIAGILWKRIRIGMPLQVDATLRYSVGRGSDELTLDDLQKDGPYNTYTRPGLPPGPIGNPGLVMIHSAMEPTESPYLYYLHDATGKIYYAKTHEEHVSNKNKYLK